MKLSNKYTNVIMEESFQEIYGDDIATDLNDTSDLPTSLIITNVDPTVYSDPAVKESFENLFKFFEEGVTFQYFRSFRRARVNFENASSAAKARIQRHQTQIGESVMNCYFAQPLNESKDGESSDTHLQPPSPERQFLISPPASPPVGWAPVEEAEPCINYDLLSAVASLAPGEVHELHPPSESHPGIFVHICGNEAEDQGPKLKIVQTKCPERVKSD